MQALYSLGNNYFRVENPHKNYNYNTVAHAVDDDDGDDNNDDDDDDNNNKLLYFGLEFVVL
jgi:hypothetical protein